MISFNAQYNLYCKRNDDTHVAIRFNEAELTVGGLKKHVRHLIRNLVDLGVKKGMRVGYTMVNNIDIIPLFIAISQIGACAVPLTSILPNYTKATLFKERGVQFVITTGKELEGIVECMKRVEANYTIATIDENDIGTYSFSLPLYKKINVDDYIVDENEIDLTLMVGSSSGTTGVAKMVYMLQGNIGEEINAVRALSEVTEGKNSKDARNLVAFPISTSVVLVMIGLMFAGETLMYSEDLSPAHFLDLADKLKATKITAPPAYFELLLQSGQIPKHDLQLLETVSMGMDFCSVGLIKRLRENMKALKYFSNGYGLVETCNVYMVNAIDVRENLDKLHYLYLPKEANNVIEVRNDEGQVVGIGEVGEIYIKGNNVVQGYANNVEESEIYFQDGWFKTGDIARREDERGITLFGRRKNFIKRGGKSVSPIMVENCINKIKGIAGCGVVGIPHPLYGEMIWAFIVRDQGEKVSLREIKKHCKEILPYYMLPDQVEFIEEIPKNKGVGKVDYIALREIGKNKLEELLGGVQE
ncbi:class I adenylate-forming enzyme family protein [Cellulosilyticum ruminicola]|uniref:class I adenylate-forming enzyme family protein n=1 Tax=Cellulosilyticum ruminicola TaxID=425254 RepID=UPI0006D29D10|nr:class I adenylate-forming enzyme family protein [Cellulosilyticum ruminicola]